MARLCWALDEPFIPHSLFTDNYLHSTSNTVREQVIRSVSIMGEEASDPWQCARSTFLIAITE